MPYRYIEGITVADIAFEASGRTLDKMFESAGLAMTNTMVKDLKSVKHRVSKKFSIKAKNVEKLLFSFLNDIVFWKDSKQLLFSGIKAKISEKNGTYSLSASLSGEKLDMKKHELVVDIKAVTMHKFEVRKEKSGWKCLVVVDI